MLFRKILRFWSDAHVKAIELSRDFGYAWVFGEPGRWSIAVGELETEGPSVPSVVAEYSNGARVS